MIFVAINWRVAILALFLLWLVSDQFVFARGGFGGDRGGFDRGGFNRDGFADHGFPGGDSFGHIDKSYYGNDHPDTSGETTRRYNAADYAHRPVDSAAVRRAYCDRHCFDADWWAHHHDGWYYPWMNGYCWGYTSWPMMAGFWGLAAASYPVGYDYGNNITYENNSVYYGSQPVATAAEYTEQASNLALSAPPIPVPSNTVTEAGAQTKNKNEIKNNIETKKDIETKAEIDTKLPRLKPEEQKDWKPLGVFSLVQGGQTDSSKLFQLFVNKDGYIHGNYYDMMTDEVKPLTGAVDKKSLRAAWTVGGVKDVIYDTGVANLLKPEGGILIHFGKDKTEQWNLVRLEQPDKAMAEKASGATETTSQSPDRTEQKDNTI